LLTQAEDASALLAWIRDGQTHLVRLDAQGQVTATHVHSGAVVGLCRDHAGALALVQESGAGAWWIASVAPTGPPALTTMWRLLPFRGSEPRVTTAFGGRCVVLWNGSAGPYGASVDRHGLLHGPTPLLAPDSSPLWHGDVVSADLWSLLLEAGDGHVWMLDSGLNVRARFPYATDRYATDRVDALVGASAGSQRHLLVWEMASMVRTLGDYPVRLQARLIGPDRAWGEPCLGDFECGRHACVDGVCCDAACGGGDPTDCQACSVSAGALVDGRCSPLSATSMCRAASGACDVAETCDGATPSCPPDALAPDGTACEDDGLACNGAERCVAGGCEASGPPECAPPGACVTGACSEPDGCEWTPIPGCCASASECDDGDADTTDECRDAMCRWTPRLRDAGPDPEPDGGDPAAEDAGTERIRDAGAPLDASTPQPPAGGCGCRGSAPAPVPPRPLVLLFALALARLRRQRERRPAR
jgi:MYXO-CTERM domain-containing protein